MPRVKRGNVRRAKRKKLLSRAKGFYQTKSKLYRSAKESVDTALKYAFVGRRRKKRDFRRLWVMRINAAARENGLTYGQLIAGLKAAGNTLDRKSLAELAVSSPASFAQPREDRRRRQAARRQEAAAGRAQGRAAQGEGRRRRQGASPGSTNGSQEVRRFEVRSMSLAPDPWPLVVRTPQPHGHRLPQTAVRYRSRRRPRASRTCARPRQVPRRARAG